MVAQLALRHRALWYCLLSLTCVLSLHSQSVQIEVPATVIQGKPFQLSYSIQGEAELTRFDNPRLQGLALLYGPAQEHSSRFQSINGRTTSSVSTSVTYTLLAENVGTATIGATTAVIGGRQVQVRGASIRVLPSKGGSAEASTSSTGRYLYRAIPGTTTVYEQQAYPYTTSSTPPQSLSYPASKPPSTTASSLRANLLETGGSNSSSRTTKGPTTVPWYSVRTSSSLSAQAPSPSPPAKWVSASPLQSIRMIPSSAQRPS